MRPVFVMANYPWVHIYAEFEWTARRAGFEGARDALEKLNAWQCTPETFETMLLGLA